MAFDWVVVGAGFTGAVLAERLASQLDQRVLVLDRRSHVAGNAYDRHDEHGVLVHQYGPHIFHTNSETVWSYLSRFTEWHPYTHRVLTRIDGKAVPVPFNLNSIDALFPAADAARLSSLLVDRFGLGARVPILKLRAESSGPLAELADYVYERVFLGYTLKQWGRPPEALSSSVTARVPVVVDRDDRYFHDRYQAMPRDGYTEMFRRILEHPNIKVELDADFQDLGHAFARSRVIYTGAIDEFFSYDLGPLPYRSLRFDFRHHDEELVQPAGQVNDPGPAAHTRTSEFKHFTGQRSAGTTVAVEYPLDHEPGVTVPYYPVPVEDAHRQYQAYAERVADEAPNVIFAGRLADYRYYNMDQAVHRALSVFDRQVLGRRAQPDIPTSR